LGVRDTGYTTFTLKNINMRQVCQSFWDKYDRFNIFLTQTSWHVGACYYVSAWNLSLEGLNFISQMSLTNPQRQTQIGVLGSVATSPYTNDVRSQGTLSALVTSFYKGDDFVDLTLRASPMRTPDDPFSAFLPLNGNFTFTIVGVKE
jgi:hypothetical protein